MTDEKQGEHRLSSVVMKNNADDGLSEAKQHTSLKFITGVRCLYGVLVLVYTLFWYYLGQGQSFRPALGLLLVCTTEIFIFTALCCVALIRNRLIRTVTYIGMVHDALLAAFIVIFTGYQASPFSYLFLIIPLYGGITLQRRGGFVGALIVSVVLTGVYLSLPLWIFHLSGDLVNIFEASSGDIHAGMSRFAAIGAAAFGVGLLTGQLANQYASAQKVIVGNARAFRHLRGIYEHILNTLPVGVVIQNPETRRILYANPMVEAVFGDIMTSEDWMSVLLKSKVAPDVSGANPRIAGDNALPGKTQVDSTAAGGTEALPQLSDAVSVVACEKHEDGKQQGSWICEHNGSYYRISEFKLALDASKPDGEMLSGYQISDMTAEILAQKEKTKRQRLALLGEFSAKIAHEIRNPLTCISGCNEMLQSEIKDEGQLQIMEMMGCEIDRLNSLLNDILVFARRPKLNTELVNVCELINSQWQIFVSDPQNEAIAFECSVPDDMVVEYDGNSLRQIMMTLWRNSSEAIGGKGSICVRGTQTPLALFISDSGNGLSESEASQAFEPFFTTKKSGTGLGLSIARQLASDNRSDLSWNGTLKEFCLKFGE